MQKLQKDGNTTQKNDAGETLNAAQSPTSMSVEQQDKPNSSNQTLVTYEELEGPFTLAITENGCAIILGNHRLTPWQDEIACRELVINKDWSLITAVIHIWASGLIDGKIEKVN